MAKREALLDHLAVLKEQEAGRQFALIQHLSFPIRAVSSQAGGQFLINLDRTGSQQWHFALQMDLSK